MSSTLINVEKQKAKEGLECWSYYANKNKAEHPKANIYYISNVKVIW